MITADPVRMDVDKPVRMDVDKASSLVSTARRLLGEGRQVDLSALEGKVHDACYGIAALPVHEGRVLLPDLEELMTALDDLTADLTAQFHSMADPRPDAGRVARAYAGPDGDKGPYDQG